MIFTPRLLLIGGVAAALLVAGGGLYYKGRSEQAALDKAAVAASQAQARVSDVTAVAVDTFQTKTVVAYERASRAIQTIERAPGAGDLLPDNLRRAWLGGLSIVETGATNDNGAVEPAVPVPAS